MGGRGSAAKTGGPGASTGEGDATAAEGADKDGAAALKVAQRDGDAMRRTVNGIGSESESADREGLERAQKLGASVEQAHAAATAAAERAKAAAERAKGTPAEARAGAASARATEHAGWTRGWSRDVKDELKRAKENFKHGEMLRRRAARR